MSNKISKFQLCSLMLINDVFSLFCLSGGISLATAVGFGVGSLIQLLVAIPVMLMYRNRGTLEYCGKIAGIVLLAGTLLWGGLLFSMLRNAGELVFVPFENLGKWGDIVTILLIALVCVYISSSGIKALSRSAVIGFALGALCIAIVVISAIMRSDGDNFSAVKSTGFFYELARGFALSGGLAGFTVMLGFVKDDIPRTTICYFATKAILSSIMLVTGVLVCGGVMEITEFPLVSSAQLTQPFSVQRIDSLFLMVFTVFAVYSIAVQASVSEFLAGEIFPFIKRYRCTIALGIMAILGLISNDGMIFGIATAVISLLGILIVPVIYFIKRKICR